MQETEFIWFNGKLVPWGEAKTHFLTHSLHYGTAVFEGIRCYKTEEGPAIFRLKEHNKRLFYSAQVIGIKNLPFTEQEMFNATKEVVKKNGLEECYIRPLFYYGYGKMGMDTVGARVEAGIAAWPWGAYLGEEGVRNGISARISSLTRVFAAKEFAHAKISGAYSNSTYAKMEALNTGFEDAIMLDKEGNVAECTGENIFIVKDGQVITPGHDFILAGITRDSIMKLAEEEGFVVKEETIARDELFGADECFMTGTAAEITPIRAVDKKAIGEGKPGPVTKTLQKAYDEAIHGEREKWKEWLELV